MSENHNDNHLDRLMDTLLAEMLGPRRVKDISAEVFAQTTRKPKRILRFSLWLAAAAALAILAVLYAPGTKPTFQKMLPGEEIHKSGQDSNYLAEASGLRLKVGDYCRINLSPRAEIRVSGQINQEQVYLLQGKVECEFDQAAASEAPLVGGGFKIFCQDGEFSPRGTKFTKFDVEKLNRDAAGGRPAESGVLVSAVSGAVLATGPWGHALLVPGETRLFTLAKAGVKKPTSEK